MDAVFSRFDSYDFEADERFQEGLKTLNSRSETKLLDMKLFFYNRYVSINCWSVCLGAHYIYSFTPINSMKTILIDV